MTRPSDPQPGWALGLHGGAGAMQSMTPELEARYREGLDRAARVGADVLERDGSAVEATTAAVGSMEASGAFNAGAGACLNSLGRVQVDAAVMRATDASIGAVAAVPGVANPIDIAAAIRTDSPHCLLAGVGAISFAEKLGLPVEIWQPTEARLGHYQKLLARTGELDAVSAEGLARLGGTHGSGDTVGAVARDRRGEIACAVSTGGLWLKAEGRVGDTPMPGSGFWAVDGIGAAIATGTGEFIMRSLLSAEVVHGIRDGRSVQEAVTLALVDLRDRFGPDKAGLVAIDARGRLGFSFDTRGMGRAAVRAGQADPVVGVWREEDP